MSKDEFINSNIKNGDKISFLNQNGVLMLGIYLGSNFTNDSFSFRNYSSGNTETISVESIHSVRKA